MQTVIVYLVVAMAVAWVVWSLVLPSRFKRSLKRSGKDCSCDGGCD